MVTNAKCHKFITIPVKITHTYTFIVPSSTNTSHHIIFTFVLSFPLKPISFLLPRYKMEYLTDTNQNKTWEEDMYWKHFHAMHFYQILPKDFLHHLALPSKFAEYMANKLRNKVSLIGPSGAAWDVEVSNTGGGLDLTGDGWEAFAKAYDLEENFLIVFKYKQNSSFEVLIFDPKNLCEKESSYFVKKCSAKPECRIERKRCVSEAASTEIIHNDDRGDTDCALSKKPKKGTPEQGPEAPRTCPTNNREVSRTCPYNREVSRTCPSDEFSEDNHDDPDFVVSDKAIDNIIVEVLSTGGRKNYQRSKSCVSNEAAAKDTEAPNITPQSKTPSAKKPGDTNTARTLDESDEMEETPTENGKEMFEKVILSPGNHNNVLSYALSEIRNRVSPPATTYSRKPGPRRVRPAKRTLPNSSRKLAFKDGAKRLSKEYLSHRREVTSDEKDEAFRRANAALTKGDFIVVMRPTGCYKRFYLSFPSEWMQKYMAKKHQLQVILRVGDKTWVTTFNTYSNRANSGGLATGWKNFAIHHNLEDSDVCLFKPASKKDDSTLVLDVEIFRVVEEITPLTPLIC